MKLVAADENNKRLETVEEIYRTLLKNKLNRDTLILAIGGGIIGDIAGYAASGYMRGIKYIHVPTTLLSAVDSSIGGKTGVNLDGAKNIIGSYHQPEMVLVDPEFLDTLPRREIICGIGEIVKYGILSDNQFFGSILKNLPGLLSGEINTPMGLIIQSIKFKVSVVEKDEKEIGGLRKILNLGHTFAHPLETIHGHRIKHGEAVIFGLTASVFLSLKLGLITEDRFARIIPLLHPFKKGIKIPRFEFDKYYEIMKLDKKNRGGKIKFVCPLDIGKVVIDVEAGKKDVRYAVEKSIYYLT
jgi:3-dehydroquinate synthase